MKITEYEEILANEYVYLIVSNDKGFKCVTSQILASEFSAQEILLHMPSDTEAKILKIKNPFQ